MKVEEIKLAFETNVQLAIIDDVKKATEVLLKDNMLLQEANGKYQSAVAGVKNQLSVAEKFKNFSLELVRSAEAKAKELGVEIKEVNALRAQITRIDEVINVSKTYTK